MERVKEVMGLGHKGEEVEGRTHTGAEGGLYPTTGTTGTHTGTTRTSHETGGMYETTPPVSSKGDACSFTWPLLRLPALDMCFFDVDYCSAACYLS